MTKKLPLIICSIFIVVALFFVIKKRMVKKADDAIIIGILQTASHPALDQARDGFMQEMKKQLKAKVSFILQNAEGSVASAQSIAKSFQTKKDIDGIFAIATPAVQAMAHLEKKKPIFISAVTDPKSLGLIHSKTNICGSTDMIDVQKQASDVKALLPNVKTIAILFNPSEINSVGLVKKMNREFKKQGITVIEVGLTSEAEVPTAVNMAARKADALIAPTDNTVASSIQVIATIAQKAKKPFIVSDNLLVQKGAFMSSGAVNYFLSGQKAAQLAVRVLTKETAPHTLKLATSIDDRIFLNKKVAQDLNIVVPKDRTDIILVN